MEIDFLVRISARTDFFHGLLQIVFSKSKAPESDKIGIWPCLSVRMSFMHQL